MLQLEYILISPCEFLLCEEAEKVTHGIIFPECTEIICQLIREIIVKNNLR